MSDAVKSYLDRCRGDESHRKVLHDAHANVAGHAKGKDFDRHRALAPVLAHARKLGFNFTEDELIRFVTGAD